MKQLVLSLLLMSFSALFAQELIEAPLQQQNIDTEEKTKTKLGIKFTLGAHTFRGDAFDNTIPKYGFGVGIYNIIDLNKKKTKQLQWELNFTNKGSKFKKITDSISESNYNKISLFYIELPVMYAYKIAQKNKNGLYLLTGAQFSYLFRNNINQSYARNITATNVYKNDLPFKTIDVAPVLGLRKNIPNGMAFQLTVKPGLINNYTSIFKERVDKPDPDNENYNYSSIYPRFKDGTHLNRNFSIELSLMF
jgi:hypothetical protein